MEESRFKKLGQIIGTAFASTPNDGKAVAVAMANLLTKRNFTAQISNEYDVCIIDTTTQYIYRFTEDSELFRHIQKLTIKVHTEVIKVSPEKASMFEDLHKPENLCPIVNNIIANAAICQKYRITEIHGLQQIEKQAHEVYESATEEELDTLDIMECPMMYLVME